MYQIFDKYFFVYKLFAYNQATLTGVTDEHHLTVSFCSSMSMETKSLIRKPSFLDMTLTIHVLVKVHQKKKPVNIFR